MKHSSVTVHAERMATYIVKDILAAIGKELEEAAHNEEQRTTSSALYGVAHIFQSFDWEWHIKQMMDTATEQNNDV